MAGVLPVEDTQADAFDWSATQEATALAAPAQPDGWLDVAGNTGRAIGAGTLRAGKSLLGAWDAVADSPEVTDLTRGWGKSLESTAESLESGMTEQGRRNQRASVLPTEGAGNDIWDSDVSTKGALGLKVAGAAPSLVASILGSVGGFVLGGPVGAAVGGGAAAGALTSGDVYNDIRDHILDRPSEQLAQENDIYAGLIDMGLDERTAKHYLVRELAANKALLMGTISAATARFGAEGLVAKLAAGKGASSVTREAVKAGLGEAGQEAAETAAQNVITFKGKTEATGEEPFDWGRLANEVAEGALVGGLLGAGTGAALHRSGKSPVANAQPVDPDVAAALTPDATAEPEVETQPLAVTVRPSGVEGEAAPEPAPAEAQPAATPYEEIAQELSTVPDAPADMAGLGPDERAALTGLNEFNEEDPDAYLEGDVGAGPVTGYDAGGALVGDLAPAAAPVDPVGVVAPEPVPGTVEPEVA